MKSDKSVHTGLTELTLRTQSAKAVYGGLGTPSLQRNKTILKSYGNTNRPSTLKQTLSGKAKQCGTGIQSEDLSHASHSQRKTHAGEETAVAVFEHSPHRLM